MQLQPIGKFGRSSLWLLLLVAVSSATWIATQQSVADEEKLPTKTFGDLLQIAPEYFDGTAFGRTEVELDLLTRVVEVLTTSEREYSSARVLYLPRNDLNDVHKRLLIGKKTRKVALDYFTRRTAVVSDIAFLFVSANGQSPELIVLDFDSTEGKWKVRD